MSETHYWPTEPGEYVLDKDIGKGDTIEQFCVLSGSKWRQVGFGQFHTQGALMADGYLGVRREKSEPVDYYWPGENEIGVYCIQHNCGQSHEAKDARWLGNCWLLAGADGVRTTENLIASGYLGVKRPAEPKPDNAAIAKQALAELRLCRKPFQTERWAYEWGPKLCQMLGAE